MHETYQIAVFGGGCFWCTEAIFQRVKGVTKVISGYASGTMDKPPNYDVSSGETGEAEVVKIEYNPTIISYNDLLDIFFHIHDSTSLNRQGADIGTQYRSVIFHTSEKQKKEAESLIKKLQESGDYPQSIVTELKPFEKFYEAESHHQNYYNKNSSQPYCQLVISPKLNSFVKKYASKIKTTM